MVLPVALALLGSIIGAIDPDKRPDPDGQVAAAAPAPEATARSPEAPRGVRLSSESMAGVFAQEFQASVAPSLDVRAGTFEMLLAAKLRSGVDGLRRRDWDEHSDFTHILRAFRARGTIGDVEVGLRGGELSGLTWGHGALVRDYYNNLDLDHGRSSMAAVVDGPGFHAEVLVDDFLAPHLVLGRGSASGFEDHLRVGVTGGADVLAPSTLVLDAAGARTVDDGQRPIANEQLLGFVAVDAEIVVGKPTEIELAPYVDVVNLLGYGSGAHFGGRMRHDFKGGRIDAALEFRFGTDDYIPGYLDTTYDIERVQSLTPGVAGITKRAELAAERADTNGFRFELGLRSRWIDVRGGVEDRPGQARGFGKIGLPLARNQVRIEGMLAYAGTPVAAGELRVAISKHAYLVADYTRRLSTAEDAIYRPFWAAGAGLGFTIGR